MLKIVIHIYEFILQAFSTFFAKLWEKEIRKKPH